MPTAATTTVKFRFFIYDEDFVPDREQEHIVASQDKMLQWDLSVLKNPVGLECPVDLYSHRSKSPDIDIHGIDHPSHLLFEGVKAPTKDLPLSPVFGEGEYIRRNQRHSLCSQRTVLELANRDSIVVPDETSYRHVFEHPVESLSIISARIYQRFEDKLPQVVFEFQPVESFSLYDGEMSVYEQKNKMNWSGIDASVLECMVDQQFANGSELIFNRNLNTAFEFIPHFTTIDLYEYRLGMPRCLEGFASSVYYSPHFPVVKDSFVLLAVDGPWGDYWIRRDSFDLSGLGDQDFMLDEYSGQIMLNPAYGSAYPKEFYCSYTAIPAIEYKLPCVDGRKYEAYESDIARFPVVEKDSMIIAMQGDKIFEDIVLSVSVQHKSINKGNVFSPVIYGEPPITIVIHARNRRTLVPIPAFPIQLLLNTPQGGRLLGQVGNDPLIRYTNGNGDAFFYYHPLTLGEAGITAWERSATNDKELEILAPYAELFEDELQDIYTYVISKDDPLIGRTTHINNPEDTIEWAALVLNGRKLILYVWDNNVHDPVTGGTGAYRPLHPMAKSNTALLYPFTLPEASPTDANIPYGGYFLIGSRKIEFSAFPAAIPLGIARRRGANFVNFSCITRLSEEAQGTYVVNHPDQVYPFGWRLPGQFRGASQLGGALYLTLNPVAGEYNAILETPYDVKTMAGLVTFRVNVTIA